ncbi:MAG TPA: ECF-type sigma factor [Fimbriiglobus sp.]|jgi:RNA polymerase sigma factor (TIGR02999 family)
MTSVTGLLDAANRGDRQAAADLLPLVYDELRKLAGAKLSREKPGQTLDATALVHEAYLRLVGEPGPNGDRGFAGCGHFLAAAAEAMRRILVEIARAKLATKRGSGGKRFELAEGDHVTIPDPDTLLAVDEALAKLAAEDPASADVARMRLFAGLSVDEAAEALGVSRATAFRNWAYARAWLTAALDDR